MMRAILIFLLFHAQLLSAQTLNDGLVAHFPFNGNANDESGNDNHGAVYSCTLVTDRFGNENSAYEFDGIDDYIRVPDSESLDVENISISVWIKPTEFKSYSNGISYYSNYSGPISKTNQDVNNQTGFSSASNYESLRFHVRFQAGAGTHPSISNVINENEWQHVVYLMDNGVVRIYKNGELQIEDDSNPGNLLLSNNEPLFIGKTFWYPNYALLTSYFTGSIDDIRIYNRALSDCEIIALLNEGSGYEIYKTVHVYDTLTTYVSQLMPQDSLVAYYPFNSNANDESGNNYHGVVNGATLTTDRFGNENSAYELDGVNDFINLSSDFDSKEKTISAWFFADNIPDYNFEFNPETSWGAILTCDHPNLTNGSIRIGVSNVDGADVVWVYKGGMDTKMNPKLLESEINISSWYNVTVSISNSVTKFYINGNLVNFVPASQNHSIDGNPYMNLGTSRLANNRYFNGKIDDIRVYNKALSDTEAKMLYYEGKSLEEIVSDNLIYDTIFINDTVMFYDTITNYIYDSISVTDTLIIDVLISDAQPVELSSIKIYPNPTNDIVNVLLDDKILNQGYSIRIVNEIGALIFESVAQQQNNYKIDISQFGAEGLYFVQILNPNGIVINTRKIILE